MICCRPFCFVMSRSPREVPSCITRFPQPRCCLPYRIMVEADGTSPTTPLNAEVRKHMLQLHIVPLLALCARPPRKEGILRLRGVSFVCVWTSRCIGVRRMLSGLPGVLLCAHSPAWGRGEGGVPVIVDRPSPILFRRSCRWLPHLFSLQVI